MHRRALSITLALGLAGAPGCAGWVPVTPTTSPGSIRDEVVRVTAQGQRIELKVVELRPPYLDGMTLEPEGASRRVIVNLALVDKVEANIRTPEQKVLLGLGIGLGSAAVLAVVVALIVDAAKNVTFFGVY